MTVLVTGAGVSSEAILIYVRDVARGIVLASGASRTIDQTYLLVNDEPVTQLEYLTAIAPELAAAAPHLHIPYRLALALGVAAEAVAHGSRMHQPPAVTRFGVRQIAGENRFLAGRARSDFGFSPEMITQMGFVSAPRGIGRSRLTKQ